MPVWVVGLGAGGHARVILDILRLDERYELVGLLDQNAELKGQSVLGVPVLGDDNSLQALVQQGVRHFFVGLGSVGDVSPRRRLYEMAVAHGLQPIDVIHPRSVISPSAMLGAGLTVLAHATINACARLGIDVIVNTGAIVEHDCVIGDHVHIASGARLASTVHVGQGSHIGLGASVRQCITIGQNAIVGAGAVVISNVPDNVVVVGVPARVLKERA